MTQYGFARRASNWRRFALSAAVLGFAGGVSAQDVPEPGDLLWTFDPGLQRRPSDVFTDPAIGPDGAIYVSHIPSNTVAYGNFYAINADGSERWSKTFPFHLTWDHRTVGFGPPTIAPNGLLYFTAGRTFFCYSLEGAEIWKRDFSSNNPWDHAPYLYPVAVSEDGRIYLPHDDQALYEIDPSDGSSVWAFRNEPPHPFAFTHPVSLAVDGSIYFPAWDRDFFKLTAGGELLFNYSSFGRTSESTSARDCYSLDAAGNCYAVRSNSLSLPHVYIYGPDGGTPVILPQEGVSVPPLIGGQGEIYFPDRFGNLYCVEPDRSVRWMLPGYADQAPILAEDGTIFALTNNFQSPTIRALSPAGETLHEIAGMMENPGAPEPVYESPQSTVLPIVRLALGRDGTLYAASNNGKIYAFAGSSPLAKSDWPKTFGGYENASRVTHLKPEVMRQPDGAAIVSDTPEYLEVQFRGRPLPTVQWFRNGEPVAGGELGKLSVGSGGIADQGNYYAIISNSVGSVQSETVSVDIQHRLTVESVAGGEVQIVPAGALHQEGSAVTLTAVPAPGYAFASWEGDASGGANPLVVVMDASKSITARFEDIEAPAITLIGEIPTVVREPQVSLDGIVSDNAGIDSLKLSVNGRLPVRLSLVDSGFHAAVELNLGPNTVLLSALDTSGRESVVEVEIEWAPVRSWSIEGPAQAAEAGVIEARLILGSPGDVSGAHFTLTANPKYLAFLDFLPSGELNGMSTTMAEEDGVLSFTFASLAGPVGPGDRLIGIARYRIRSLPEPRNERVVFKQINLAAEDGSPITDTSGIRHGVIEIHPRRIPGDVNNNGRYDTGDSQQLLRLLNGLEELRPWDELLNDANGSGGLDIGDVIVVLRTAAGLREQPQVPGETQAAELRMFAPFEEGAPFARLTIDPPYAPVGSQVKVEVVLSDLARPFGGASFVLEYPVEALRLENTSSHRSGPLQPASALQVWNVSPAQNDFAIQNGRISFAAGSADAWADSAQGGVLAELLFTVQPGATAQPGWPVLLRETEVSTERGLEVVASNVLNEFFIGQPLSWTDWLTANFEEDARDDEQIAGSNADPDRDGHTNRAEYLAGSDPWVTGPGLALQAVILHTPDGGSHYGMQFQYDVRAVDMSAIPQLSGDLQLWNRAGGEETGGILTEVLTDASFQGHLARRTFLYRGNGPAPAQQFFRLQLTAP